MSYAPKYYKTINMPAFGKARPRVTKNGTYMPREYQAKRDELRWRFGPVDITDMCRLSVTAVRQMPKSWSQKKRDMMRGQYARPKPDMDNIVGAVMDALFVEDDIVVSLVCDKVWGDSHELQISITELESYDEI